MEIDPPQPSHLALTSLMIGMSFPDSQAASVPLASHPGLLAGPSIPFGPEFASFILFLRFSRSLVALLESASERGCWAILNTTEGIKILSCRWRKDEFGGGGGGVTWLAGRGGAVARSARRHIHGCLLYLYSYRIYLSLSDHVQDMLGLERHRQRRRGYQ